MADIVPQFDRALSLEPLNDAAMEHIASILGSARGSDAAADARSERVQRAVADGRTAPHANAASSSRQWAETMLRNAAACRSCRQAPLSGDSKRLRGYDAVSGVARDFFAARFFDTDRFRGATLFSGAGAGVLDAVLLTAVLPNAFLAAAFLAAQRLRSASAMRCRPSSEMLERFFGGPPGSRVPGGRPGPRRCGVSALNPRSAASALSIAVFCRSRSLIIC